MLRVIDLSAVQRKWKVDQDNVKYFDAIMKNDGKIVSLDYTPYIEYLNEFGIFYTFLTSRKTFAKE